VTRDSVEARYAETLAELNEARADALAVVGREVAAAYDHYLAAVDQLDTDEADTSASEVHVAARAAFLGLRWKLTVQREAIGLTDHSWVDQTFPLAARDRRVNEPTEAQRRLMHYRLLR
jgi:hypothetical protein